jgi:DNA-binding CsgD family transcriptional regulator
MGSKWNRSIIEAVFAEAAVDSGKWSAAMDTVAAATGSAGAILLPVPARPVAIAPFSESLGPAAETYFKQGWAEHDLRYRGIPKLLRTGTMCDFDSITADGIKRSPYYQEFLAPHGLRWFGGIRIESGEDLWCISIQRSIKQGPFSPQELKQLAALSPQLSSAATTARALGFARAEGALDAFEVSDLAAVMLNGHGNVLRVNRAAERLLGRDPSLQRGRIVSADHQANQALDRTIHGVMTSTNGTTLMPPVLLPRSGERRPLLAYATRLAAVSQDLFAPCQAILVLVDMDGRVQPPEAVLRQVFRLSAAEARLARGLAAGRSLDSLAEELAITKDTARHELKSVFAKLDVHRQSELVALLARLLQT